MNRCVERQSRWPFCVFPTPNQPCPRKTGSGAILAHWSPAEAEATVGIVRTVNPDRIGPTEPHFRRLIKMPLPLSPAPLLPTSKTHHNLILKRTECRQTH